MYKKYYSIGSPPRGSSLVTRKIMEVARDGCSTTRIIRSCKPYISGDGRKVFARREQILQEVDSLQKAGLLIRR